MRNSYGRATTSGVKYRQLMPQDFPDLSGLRLFESYVVVRGRHYADGVIVLTMAAELDDSLLVGQFVYSEDESWLTECLWLPECRTPGWGYRHWHAGMRADTETRNRLKGRRS